jgi:hypothetical protein
MSMKTTTTAAAALAAIALPGAALAHDGEKERGSKGREHAGAKHAERDGEHAPRRHHSKGRAFVVRGVDLSDLSVTDGKLAGALKLDPTAANRHARKLLGLTKAKLAGGDIVALGGTGDAVRVKYHGLTATDALQPTDVVKVHGKVSRKGGKLDIRKITVKRGETKSEKKSDDR